MLTRKTVIVVGAGASHELGLQLGTELREEISKLLNSAVLNRPSRKADGRKIAECLHEIAQKPGASNIQELRQKCSLIRDALPVAISIDNLLDAHRNDTDIALIGKLGIANAILNAERKSKLNKALENREESPLYSLADTWLLPMFQLLTEGVVKEDAATIFDNVTFIVFNYDRCLEVFLTIALKAYYGFDDQESSKIAATAKIIHPYGSAGELTASSSLATADFGALQCNLSVVAESIRTFSEGLRYESHLKVIKDSIATADQIAFLGFAFHPLNMEILAVDKPSNVSKVFGTTLGLSDAAVRSVKQIIGTTFKKTPREDDLYKLDKFTFSEINLEKRKSRDFLFAHFRGLT